MKSLKRRGMPKAVKTMELLKSFFKSENHFSKKYKEESELPKGKKKKKMLSTR
jgi:hypothetical protein